MTSTEQPNDNQQEVEDSEQLLGEHTKLKCFTAIARHHGVDLSIERLLHDHALGGEEPPVRRLVNIAKDSGFKAESSTLSWSDISNLGEALPVIAFIENDRAVVIGGFRGEGEEKEVAILDPLADKPGFIYVKEAPFCSKWSGEVMLLKRHISLTDPDQKFGLKWFIPEFLRQKKIFRDVIIAALLLHLFALAVPIFFQLVIDKVLNHEGYSTLLVLTVGITVALVFDAIFSFLRRYLLLFATNKVDIRVATRTFGKLLRLPIDFFENASSGVLVKHMQQSEKIRQFLSGKLFLTLLDATSLFVFVPVLFFYSPRLTLVVLFFTCLIGSVIALLIAPFRKRLAELYEAEGQRQALLVETIHGMRTIKSLALEPRQRRDWDGKAAQAVNMNFKVGKISSIAGSVTGLLEKLMLIAVIAIGALGVFDGSVSIGALVAFQMISNRVSGPLVQLVTLVHEYQETALSVRMLGEIMNRPTEREGNARGIRPEFKGRIDFENIGFRYAPDSQPALSNISFTINEGTIFGLVGRSGSGKTTVTRLIQGLYSVQEGVIRFDGYDIREIDLVHLRTNIGVVLQDNFLFQGTIRDNIAAARPEATFEEVIEVARMAGADEFIERLPRGFDTPLTENASNLSGGQKQRLAIARALLTKPRILILDEATSALDPESEAIIQKNLKLIAKGRTVIIVSHRLSSLTEADAILVLKQGVMEDIGPHHELVERSETYQHLWNQQTRHLS